MLRELKGKILCSVLKVAEKYIEKGEVRKGLKLVQGTLYFVTPEIRNKFCQDLKNIAAEYSVED